MINLFEPEDEYYSLMSWHSDQRQRLVQENMFNLGRILKKNRVEPYEARVAAKPLNLLIKKHVQDESKQILKDKKRLDQLLKIQAEELKEFVKLVKLIYPKFDGFDKFWQVSPLPCLLEIS